MGLSGTEQYLRVVKLAATSKQGQGKDYSGLRCKFTIEKTSESTANTSKIEIYNLNSDSRTFLEGKEMRVVLEAGYPGATEILTVGNITRAISVHNHPDWITTIESGDGQRELKDSHLDVSFAPGTTFQAIFLQGVKALGVTLGPTVFAIPQIATGGFSFSGTAKELMDKLAKRFSLEWSVQDGAVQVSTDGVPLPGIAISVSSTTGLIGNVVKTQVSTAEKNADSADNGNFDGIQFQMLINGEVKPGRLIQVISQQANGFYKVRKVVFEGDTHDGPWFANVEAEPIK